MKVNQLEIYVIHISLILLVLSFFASCVSVSHQQEFQNAISSFPNIEKIEPKWEPFADGVDYFHGRIVSPKLRFWALRADLFSPSIEIVVSGEPVSAKVSSFVQSNNLIAGINALPFDVSSSREGLDIKNAGIVVAEGKLLSPANSRYDALVFYKDGKTAIVSQALITSASAENIKNAAGGFHQLLIDGELTQRVKENSQNENASRHPRSAAGVSADGRYLYLLVIDGRQAASIGAAEWETAALLLALGSWNGINFDGGGSSALALKFPDGNVRVVNTPVHKIIPGEERAVAGCLGIRINK